MNLYRKLPVGIQSFEKLRTDKYLYVDKTEHLFRLILTSSPYFLSRPRRFGKSRGRSIYAENQGRGYLFRLGRSFGNGGRNREHELQ